jgi:hypothetical protein
MTRYFFDVKGKTSFEYDFKGLTLPSLEHAQQMAELIATDLGCTRPDLAPQAEVQIRSSHWKLLDTVSIKSIETLAA